MSQVTAETTHLIHSLQIYQREIAKEGNDQLVTIAKFFAKHDIPDIIEKLRRLEVLENEHKADRPTRAYALRIHD